MAIGLGFGRMPRIENRICHVCILFSPAQKVEERETLVQQRIDHETKERDPNRLNPKGTIETRRLQQKRSGWTIEGNFDP